MRKNILTTFLYLILFGVALFLGYSFFWLEGFSYESFISYLSELFGKADWGSDFQEILPESRFNLTRQLVLGSCIFYGLIVLPVLLWQSRKIIAKLDDFLGWLVAGLKTAASPLFLTANKPIRIFLILLFLVSLVKAYYYVFTVPMQYDEAWTYNYYVSNGPLVPFVAPHNNHILFTIIAQWLSGLPFEPYVNMRFMLPIVGHISAIALLLMTWKHIGKWAAVLTTTVFLATGPVIFYMIYARAYLFTVLFTIIVLWAILNIIAALEEYRKENRYNYWVLGIAAVLGFYSMPSFLYPMIGLGIGFGILWLQYGTSPQPLKRLGLTAIFSIFATLLLYSPMIANTGLEWLREATSNASFQNQLTIKRWFRRTSYFLFFRTYTVFPLIIIILISLIGTVLSKNKHKKVWVMCLVSFIIAPLAFFIQGQFLEPRLFTYLAIFIAVVLAILFSKFPVQKNWFPITIAAMLFIGGSIQAHQHNYFNWSVPWDKTTKQLSQQLRENEISETYSYFFYAKPGLEYYSKTRTHRLNILMPQTNSKDYKAFDSEKSYESVIWYKEFKGQKPDLSAYTIIWENDIAEFWIPKKSD